jgi:hypothetical protein
METEKTPATSFTAACATDCLSTYQTEYQPLPGGVHSVILLDSHKLSDDMASENGLDNLNSNELGCLCSICLNPLHNSTVIIETPCKVNYSLAVVEVVQRRYISIYLLHFITRFSTHFTRAA